MSVVTHEVQLRRKTVINTDPLRRCYDGVNFSERVEWSEWERMCGWESLSAAEACCRAYKNDPPHGREYRVVELP